MSPEVSMLGVGVLDHRLNPTVEEVEAQARVAEDAGAGWLTISDNFTWRDTWILTAAAALVTDEIKVGPGVTNPYLRHPFHTVAALATIHDLSDKRAMLGVGAGRSALPATADVSRRDAHTKVAELVDIVRRVEGGWAPRSRQWPIARQRPGVRAGADAHHDRRSPGSHVAMCGCSR